MNNEQETKFTSPDLEERELEDQELQAVAGGIVLPIQNTDIVVLDNNPSNPPQYQVVAIEENTTGG